MSKKHFIALAKALKSTRPGPEPLPDSEFPDHVLLRALFKGRAQQWNQDVRMVADACGNDSGRFEYSTFVHACGGLF